MRRVPSLPGGVYGGLWITFFLLTSMAWMRYPQLVHRVTHRYAHNRYYVKNRVVMRVPACFRAPGSPGGLRQDAEQADNGRGKRATASQDQRWPHILLKPMATYRVRISCDPGRFYAACAWCAPLDLVSRKIFKPATRTGGENQILHFSYIRIFIYSFFHTFNFSYI